MSVDKNLKGLGKYLERMGHSTDCEVHQRMYPDGCVCGFSAALEVMSEVRSLRAQVEKLLAESKEDFVKTEERLKALITERDSALLQVEGLQKEIAAVRDVMASNGDKKDPAYSDWYNRTREMDYDHLHPAEKPKRQGPIMHVPGCGGEGCDCAPVFGEKLVLEPQKIEHCGDSVCSVDDDCKCSCEDCRAIVNF